MNDIPNLNRFVADELSHKVFKLTLALEEALKFIANLEQENKKLKELIEHNYVSTQEI